MTDDGEMVAWVDRNETLIQVIPRTLANSDPKYLHVEIADLIVDNNRSVLLQLRSHTKKVNPSLWVTTAAGHVTYGDSIEKTAHKELVEEMGFDVPRLVHLFRERVAMPSETHYCHWFLGKSSGAKIAIDPGEVDEYAWVTEADFTKFSATHTVADRTTRVLRRFWSGEWDKLLK